MGMSCGGNLVLYTPPGDEPVSVSEIKTHCRISHDYEDDLIESLGKAARKHIEDTMLWRQLMPATYKLFFEYFPSQEIYLPMPPLVSVTSVKYLDSAGVQQTLSSSNYIVDTNSEPGRITPSYSNVWPSVGRVQANAVEITYAAGYASAADVPTSFKQAILMLAAHWYEHREGVHEIRFSETPIGVRALCYGQQVKAFV